MVRSQQSEQTDQKYGNINCTIILQLVQIGTLHYLYASFCKSTQKPKSDYILASFGPDL